ncbi:hypothetical protein Moror_3694 [Moniliophthora roreri MCA 2997]|uniref:Uncharacterized protein n=1 Tax=Moniliophthora roreri (strain MCA 2997) TaxID=1381753 RepID=V2XSY4_MONRO|nr:hypothetical protein Moror_3694 [Moniliophthora roreri MCA 2997]
MRVLALYARRIITRCNVGQLHCRRAGTRSNIRSYVVAEATRLQVSTPTNALSFDGRHYKWRHTGSLEQQASYATTKSRQDSHSSTRKSSVPAGRPQNRSPKTGSRKPRNRTKNPQQIKRRRRQIFRLTHTQRQARIYRLRARRRQHYHLKRFHSPSVYSSQSPGSYTETVRLANTQPNIEGTGFGLKEYKALWVRKLPLDSKDDEVQRLYLDMGRTQIRKRSTSPEEQLEGQIWESRPTAPSGGIVLHESMGLKSEVERLDPEYQTKDTTIQWSWKKAVPSSNGQLKYLAGVGREWVLKGQSGAGDGVIDDQVRKTLTATVQWGWKQKEKEIEKKTESFPAKANPLVEPEQRLGRSDVSTERSSDGTDNDNDIVNDHHVSVQWGWKKGAPLPSGSGSSVEPEELGWKRTDERFLDTMALRSEPSKLHRSQIPSTSTPPETGDSTSRPTSSPANADGSESQKAFIQNMATRILERSRRKRDKLLHDGEPPSSQEPERPLHMTATTQKTSTTTQPLPEPRDLPLSADGASSEDEKLAEMQRLALRLSGSRRNNNGKG